MVRQPRPLRPRCQDSKSSVSISTRGRHLPRVFSFMDYIWNFTYQIVGVHPDNAWPMPWVVVPGRHPYRKAQKLARQLLRRVCIRAGGQYYKILARQRLPWIEEVHCYDYDLREVITANSVKDSMSEAGKCFFESFTYVGPGPSDACLDNDGPLSGTGGWLGP